MNIIFISIGGLNNLNDNAVYPDLLRKFRDNGHNVYIVCQREKRFGLPTEMNIEYGMKVLRIKTGNITKVGFIEKGISTLIIGHQFKKEINKYFGCVKFDIILYSTPPITVSSTVKYLKRKSNSFSYLMLKDIFPQNAIDLGILSESGIKKIILKFFKMKEKELYLISDTIGCMSDANIMYLKYNNKYLDESKIQLCPNTINPIDDIKIEKNLLRSQFNLPNDKLLLVYGGNFGKPQNVDYIIEVLKDNSENEKIAFVMCGSGTDFYKIKEFMNSSNSKNVYVLDALKKDNYDKLLDACDIGLIFLDNRFTIPNFPSRLLDYMNHSMPIIAATDVNTDVGQVIENNGFGWWCESKETNELKNIIESISMNRDIIKEKGKLGRKYLENHYDTEIAYNTIMDAFYKNKKNV